MKVEILSARLYSAPKNLCPMDYYRHNQEALLAERKRKVKAVALKRREVNRLNGLTETNTEVYLFSKVDLSENY